MTKLQILEEAIKGLPLNDKQIKIVAEMKEHVDDYSEDFLKKVAQVFEYEWDTGPLWKVEEIAGQKQIVRCEAPTNHAPNTLHAFKVGQKLVLGNSVFPVPVKVTSLLEPDRYTVRADITGETWDVEEADLWLPEESLFV